MAKVGRPKTKIDYELAEKLASIMCTQEEIATMFDCDVRTLQRDDEFCRVFKKGKDKGRISLRRMQFKKAEKGSDSMLIWLGKQVLNQRDVIETNNESLDKVNQLLEKIEKEAKDDTNE